MTPTDVVKRVETASSRFSNTPRPAPRDGLEQEGRTRALIPGGADSPPVVPSGIHPLDERAPAHRREPIGDFHHPGQDSRGWLQVREEHRRPRERAQGVQKEHGLHCELNALDGSCGAHD